MPVASCMFAAAYAAEAEVEVQARLSALASFYRPAGLPHLAVAFPRSGFMVGQISGSATELADTAGTLVWGEPLPTPLAAPGALATAPASHLRGILGMTAAFAWDSQALTLVNNSGGPATLYEAHSAACSAFATHAVAAALLVGRTPRMNPSAVAEFVALDFVGGDRTLLEGVTVVEAATRIRVLPTGAETECYWPASERWELLPERRAFPAAERELAAALHARLPTTAVGLPLTSGLDSSVIAVALNEMAAGVTAFTWGEEGWPDPVGAARTAATLGFQHRTMGSNVLDSSAALEALHREARWTDGVTALAPSRRVWPAGCSAFAAGMGGETGRAFYYDAWSALLEPRPSRERLARQLGIAGRLRHAHEASREAVSQSVMSWVESAQASGVRGWRVLDVLYAEQRVRRWGRSHVPLLAAEFVPVFTPPPVARALVSLPDRDRLTDGFHRGFLRARGFPVADRLGEIPHFSAPGWFVRRRVHALRRGREQPFDDPEDPYLRAVWAERAEAVEWLRDQALIHPVVTDSLGEQWAREAGEAFAHGRIRSTERVQRAAGAVALATALAELPKDLTESPSPRWAAKGAASRSS